MRTLIIAAIAILAFEKSSLAQIKLNPVATEKIQPTPATVSKPVAFRLSDAMLGSLPSSGAVALNTSLKEFDLSNNATGGQFKAPENGIYHFDVNLTISPTLTDYKNYLRFHLSLMKGSSVVEQFTLMNPQTAYTTFHSMNISTTVMLNKGDVITTKYSADAEPNTSGVKVVTASFSGFKVASFQTGTPEGTIR
jgi:hypothetical protein